LDDLVLHKVRLAVLWLFSEVSFIGIMLLTFLKPGIVQDVISGNLQGVAISQELLAGYAFIVLLGLVMAFVSVTVRDSINRGANIVMGMVGIILSFLGLSEQFTNPYAYAVIIWIAHIIVDASIVWYAYKWPKKQ
jgi:energy-converting hydrogenase Eha subunit E